MTLQPHSQLGPYEILAAIGAGGMGEVYRARDPRLNREVAVKVLAAKSANDAAALARFEREAHAIAALNHPNICSVYDVGTFEGSSPYLVMELLEGETLHQRLARGALDAASVVEIGIALADGLAAAHARGLMHRDLKPANIFLTTRGIPKILDFGLAKASNPADVATRVSAEPLTGQGVAVGTLSYMSPEQLRGEDVDARSDLFSLGMVLYEMATGRRAFDGTTTAVITNAILEKEPAAPRSIRADLPPRLEETILRLLEKDALLRYQSATDLRADLMRAKRGFTSVPTRSAETQTVSLPSAPAVEASPSDSAVVAGLIRRHRFTAVGLAALLIGAAITGALLLRRATTVDNGINPGTIEIQPVTFTGDASLGVISPDGKFIAFVRTEDSQQSLWVRQLGTDSQLKLVTVEKTQNLLGLTVTPDSQQIDYVLYSNYAAGGELMRIPAFGGTPRKILGDVWSAPGWSPDGKTMAIVREHLKEKEGAIVLANADGTGERVLATLMEPLVFRSLVYVDRPPSRPAWSPDGTSLIAATHSLSPQSAARSGEIAAFDTTTGAKRTASLPACGLDVEAVWLNPTQWITSRPSDGTPYQLQMLSALRPAAPIALTRDLVDYFGISLTADRHIGASWRRERRAGIWTSDDSGERWTEAVSETASNPTVYSIDDSGRLTYTSRSDAGQGIWTLKPGSVPQRIAEHGDAPSSNTAAKTVVFNDGCSRTGLYRTDLDGSGLKLLAGHYAGWTSLSPDGTTVYFISQRNDGQFVFSIPVAGGEPHELVHHLTSGPIQVSPEGKRILFSFFGEPDANTVVVICDLPECSSQKTVLPNILGAYGWMPDGRSIGFVKNEDAANIWIQPLDGSPARQFTHFTDHHISNFTWSPDGKHIAVSRYKEQSDIVRIRGFQ